MSSPDDPPANGTRRHLGNAWRGGRGARAAAVAVALLLCAAVAAAQEDAPDEVSTQLWGNVILSYPKSARLYFELDLEPRRLKITLGSSAIGATTHPFEATACNDQRVCIKDAMDLLRIG